MSCDISHCRGRNCPIKDSCQRTEIFKKPEVFKYEGKYCSVMDEPFRYNHGKFSCEFFIGDPVKMLLAEMQSIMGERFTKKGKKK